MEGKVLNLLDIQTGKSETTKEKVLIVKKDGAKWIGIFCFLLVMVGVGFVFNASYKLQFVRREALKEHRIHDVTNAVDKMKAAEVMAELRSHLVSEVQERDSTLQEKDNTMKKIEETLNENENIMSTLFKKIDSDLAERLSKVPDRLEADFKTMDKSARTAAIQKLIDEIQTGMASSLTETATSLKDSLGPIKATVEESFKSILQDETERSNTATDNLDRVNQDLAHGELAAAVANSRVEEHVKQDRYSHGEQTAMLATFFDSITSKLAHLQLQQEELVAADGTDVQLQLDPEVVQRLTDLLGQTRSGKIDASQAADYLYALVEAGSLPPPNPDASMTDYITKTLRRAQQENSRDRPAEDCSGFRSCRPDFPCRARGGSCSPLDAATQACPKSTVRCSVFPGEYQKEALYQNQKRTELLMKFAEMSGQWRDGQLSASHVFSQVQESVRAGKIPASWLVPSMQATPARGPAEPVHLSQETKDWMRSTFEALNSGSITQEFFYKDIMKKYNEGLIPKETMMRMQRQFRHGAENGGKHPRQTRGRGQERPPAGKMSAIQK